MLIDRSAVSGHEFSRKVTLLVAEEVEKRISNFLSATQGTDFAELFKKVAAENALLKAHNRKFFLLLEECLRSMAPVGDGETEPPLRYKIRTLVESNLG